MLQSIGGGGGGGLAGNVSADALAADSHFSDRGQATLATHVALGAASGVSGDGHYVTFAINQGGQIATAGQGSHALLVQSIGAGGGSAGDSSSMAATAGPSSAETAWTLEPRFTLGASGDAGGRGGPVGAAIGGLIHVAGTDVRVTPDPVGSPVSIISTYGDYANGLTVQSIGGGGGNAGFGSARTQASSLGATLAPTIKLGGAGAGGG
ncbi:hypothetical protein GOQ28_18485, partial [Bordetella sp. 02P26C-1]|nr:hypothetical protein [Bordetella sp. 02P26C-1]